MNFCKGHISDFVLQCLTVLQRLDVWLSGGSDLCVWNRKLDLLCKTSHLTEAGKNLNDSLWQIKYKENGFV